MITDLEILFLQNGLRWWRWGGAQQIFKVSIYKELAKSLTSFSGERQLSHYWCFKANMNTGWRTCQQLDLNSSYCFYRLPLQIRHPGRNLPNVVIGLQSWQRVCHNFTLQLCQMRKLVILAYCFNCCRWTSVIWHCWSCLSATENEFYFEFISDVNCLLRQYDRS